MSNSTNHELCSWKVAEAQLRCTVFKYQGKTLSERDGSSYGTAIFLQGLILVDLLVDDPVIVRRSVLQWYKTMQNVDVSDAVSAFKIVLTFLRNYSERGSLDYDGFKHRLRAEIPCIGAILAPIRGDISLFLEEMSSSSFSKVNQFLSFSGRLSFRDIDRSQESLYDYLAIEEKLCQLEYPTSLIKELNLIMREWMSDFSWDTFLPKHGPGSVAMIGRASLRDKYENLGKDTLLSYFLTKDVSDENGYYPLPPVDLDRTCQVVFVPKSATSWRTISMEPATLQYFQQGIWRSLDHHMRRHPVLNQHISVHEQEFNRTLAMRASAEGGSYATIDLSSASDSVSWELVKGIFAGTDILRSCYATRSRSALLPNGKKISLKKFAPMGSALCFPIECLVFAVICEYATRDGRHTARYDAYRVYGDDIIVRHEFAQDVIGLLENLGFCVNTQKTFVSRFIPFRESCGGEYYQGVNVTPFRLSRRFSCDEIDAQHPGVLQACIDGANIAYRYGLKLTRLWFVHRLISLPQKLRPLFSESSAGIHSNSPTNYHLRTVHSLDWQCDLYLHGTIGSQPLALDDKETNETIRLYEWLRLASNRSRPVLFPDDLIEANISRSRSLIQVSRTPVIPPALSFQEIREA